MSKIKVVTIGRLYCSGGSSIGKRVAQKLGIPCYDREIVEMAAEKSGISMAEIKKYEESVLNPMKKPINLFGFSALDVFIYSSLDKRMQTAMSEPHNIPADEVEYRLKKYDKKRGDYYNSNTNKKWGTKFSYDLCLDSGTLGYDMCADIIAHTVEASS